MTTNETCPHCGAERQEKPHDGYMPWRYECGTLIHTGERLKANCYRSQIEQQAVAIERLKQAVLDAANNDLFSLARPLVKFLCDNHHPHTKIIITCNTVELLEGICGADISEFLRD